MNKKMKSRSNVNISSTRIEIKKYRKERNTELLFEIYNLTNDPNLTKDGTGKYICILCKTKHLTEMSYVKHRDGKKHKRKIFMKEDDKSEIGIPKYHVKNLISGDEKGYGVIIEYKLAKEMPSYRFVNSLEQCVENIDENFKYLVFICKPYENIGFKFENKEIKKNSIYEDIDEETGIYNFHFYFL